jgi:NTP pyrophosphatase (non-canonical NTP hydrolase)
MNLNKYQELAWEYALPQAKTVPYMTFGMGGEVGELMSKYAKYFRGDDKYTEMVNFKEEVMKEIGDVLWFVAGLCSVYNTSLEAVAQQNLDKLEDRRKRNKIQGDGDNR